MSNPPGVFKNAIVNQDINLLHDSGQKFVAVSLSDLEFLCKEPQCSIYATTMDDFIKTSEEYDLKYISINGLGGFEVWYPYLIGLYENEQKYKFLKKVFDSSEEGYEKFYVKVFEIDYKIYHELNG